MRTRRLRDTSSSSAPAPQRASWQKQLRPEWSLFGAGAGGELALAAGGEEARLYRALQGLCIWAFALAVRVVGHERFDGRALWDFVSGGSLGAFLFAKGALCFQQWREERWDPKARLVGRERENH